MAVFEVLKGIYDGYKFISGILKSRAEQQRFEQAVLARGLNPDEIHDWSELILAQMDVLNQNIDRALLSGFIGQANTAIDAMANFNANGLESELVEARNQSRQAFNGVLSYAASNPLVTIGALLQVTSVRIRAIEELDDGAFLQPSFKSEVEQAIGSLDTYLAALSAKAADEASEELSGTSLIYRNATGTLQRVISIFADDLQERRAAAYADGLEADKEALGYFELVTIRTDWANLIKGAAWSGTDGQDAFVGQDPPYPESVLAPNNYYAVGLGGSDSLVGGVGNDVLKGGGETPQGDASIEARGLPDNDTLRGGLGDDVLRGGPGDDWLYGGLGWDRLYGGSGSDWVSYADAADFVVRGVTVALGVYGNQVVRTRTDIRAEERDLLSFDIENLEGTSFEDALVGDTGRNILAGLGGNDSLRGGGGDDELRGGTGNDLLDGGEGLADLVTYAASTSGIVISLAVTGPQNGGSEGFDTLVDVENLIGSPFNDQLTGNGLANRLVGGSGFDTLAGGGGPDTLVGGDFNDVISGGDGNDVLIGDDDGPASSDAADSMDGGAGADTFLWVSSWRPSSIFNGNTTDTLNGGSGRDVYALAGLDPTGLRRPVADLIGDFETGYSNDFVDLSAFGDEAANGFGTGFFRLVQSGGEAQLQVRFADATYGTVLRFLNHSIADFAALNFSPGSGFTPVPGPPVIPLNRTGTTGPDALDGAILNDILRGREANDVLRGLAGPDYLVGDGGADSLDGGDGDDALYGDTGNDQGAFGPPGVDTLDGGAGDDRLYGGAGADVLRGGPGDDVYADFEAIDVVTEAAGEGSDLIETGTGYAEGTTFLLPAHVEDLRLSTAGVPNDQGGVQTFAVNGTGNGLDNVITGSRGSNTLSGLDGDDTLDGDVGADTLLGGAGNDTLRYWDKTYADVLDGGDGSDTADFDSPYPGGESGGNPPFALNLSLAVTGQQVGGFGAVTLISIEKVRGTYLSDRVTANAVSNTLHGLGGNDTLDGAGGDDSLDGGEDDDVLVGGTGVNVLDGYAGRDTASYAGMTVAVVADLRIQTGAAAGLSSDTFFSIENLTGGSGGDDLAGDESPNILEGGAGSDRLHGFGGDDVLVGGPAAAGGYNELDGGSGRDTASYEATTAPVYADLRSGAGFIGGALTDVMTGVENLVGGSGNDVLVGDDGSNTLRGGPLGQFPTFTDAGLDQIYGMGGDDVFEGATAKAGTGQNQLFGGEGQDTVDYSAQTTAVYVELRAQAGYVGGVLRDLMNSVENAVGGRVGDTLVGTDADANALFGGGGSDILFGLGGDDVLNGGSADGFSFNQLWGGNGSDTASYEGTVAGVYADLAVQAGWVRQGPSLVLTDLYNSIENLAGGEGADTLAGDVGANVIVGGAGADILYGRGGADTFVYRAASDSSLAAGYDTVADFQTGLDKLDLRALGIAATAVTIASGGGATSLYADTDPEMAGPEFALVLIGANAIALGDIVF